MIEIRSSWYVVDGVVVSADVIPRAGESTGRVTAARQEIRRQMRELSAACRPVLKAKP